MVISFEEKDRAKIEAKGITIIEFKRFLYGDIKTAAKAWDSLLEYIGRVLDAWNTFKKWLIETADNLKLVFEEISECFQHPTSFRYKIVKFVSKCTGIEKRRLWTMTRRTWLARSCC